MDYCAGEEKYENNVRNKLEERLCKDNELPKDKVKEWDDWIIELLYIYIEDRY